MSDVARFAKILAAQCSGVRSEYGIYIEREKRRKKGIILACRSAAEVEEQRGAAEAHMRRRA